MHTRWPTCTHVTVFVLVHKCMHTNRYTYTHYKTQKMLLNRHYYQSYKLTLWPSLAKHTHTHTLKESQRSPLPGLQKVFSLSLPLSASSGPVAEGRQ